MALTDNDLLDFPTSDLVDADASDARRLLHEHGDVFRAQLVAALHLTEWADRLEANPPDVRVGEEVYIPGYVNALRAVAAHLRQGDYLPGGRLYEDAWQKRFE